MQTPAKKNRIHCSLDSTAEEDGDTPRRHSRSRSRSESNGSDHTPPTKGLGINPAHRELGLGMDGISSSPPSSMKIKVRQISQGVEDLTWTRKKPRIGAKSTNEDEDDQGLGQDEDKDEMKGDVDIDDKNMELEPPSSSKSSSVPLPSTTIATPIPTKSAFIDTANN